MCGFAAFESTNFNTMQFVSVLIKMFFAKSDKAGLVFVIF